MRIILFFTFTCIAVARQFNAENYTEKFTEFCYKINNNVCTEEMIETGMIYFNRKLQELKTKMDEKRIKQKNVNRERRLQKLKEERFLQQLREHFLDRHI